MATTKDRRAINVGLRIVRSGSPHYFERSLFWMHRDYRGYARILLTLTDDDLDVKIIVNVSHFDTT